MKTTGTYKLNIFLFLLPGLILFIGILIAPIIMSAYYSLFDFHTITGADRVFKALTIILPCSAGS